MPILVPNRLRSVVSAASDTANSDWMALATKPYAAANTYKGIFSWATTGQRYKTIATAVAVGIAVLIGPK
ncbi:hypothetical protein RRF57_007858 [Xylaria bambusicola]|uniref:Uncharacterized protein n=1 Tax=Xylaria bambusicola TaxID=326684 RepID=A0AAN7UW11_9PEZI